MSDNSKTNVQVSFGERSRRMNGRGHLLVKVHRVSVMSTSFSGYTIVLGILPLMTASWTPYPSEHYYSPYGHVITTLTTGQDARGTCSSETPCFDRVLNLVYEGPFEFDTTPGSLEAHWALAGVSRDEVIQEGRQALEFFQNKHGLTFIMTDDHLLDVNNGITSTDGNAMILPFRYTADFRSRVYSVTRGEKSQFMNRPKDTGGWFVSAIQDIPPTGEFGEVVPSGAALFYGSYIFSPCPKNQWRPCYSVLDPHLPWEPVVLRFQSRKYIRITGLPPTDYIFFDWTVQHERWGAGTAKGYVCLKEGTANTYEGREMITFEP